MPRKEITAWSVGLLLAVGLAAYLLAREGDRGATTHERTRTHEGDRDVVESGSPAVEALELHGGSREQSTASQQRSSEVPGGEQADREPRVTAAELPPPRPNLPHQWEYREQFIVKYQRLASRAESRAERYRATEMLANLAVATILDHRGLYSEGGFRRGAQMQGHSFVLNNRGYTFDPSLFPEFEAWIPYANEWGVAPQRPPSEELPLEIRLGLENLAGHALDIVGGY